MKFFLIVWNIIWVSSMKEIKILKAKNLKKIVKMRKRVTKKKLVKNIHNPNLNPNQKERMQKRKKRQKLKKSPNASSNDLLF